MANDFPSVLNSPSNKSQNWEESENFPGPKTAASDCFDKYLLQNISWFLIKSAVNTFTPRMAASSI